MEITDKQQYEIVVVLAVVLLTVPVAGASLLLLLVVVVVLVVEIQSMVYLKEPYPPAHKTWNLLPTKCLFAPNLNMLVSLEPAYNEMY